MSRESRDISMSSRVPLIIASPLRKTRMAPSSLAFSMAKTSRATASMTASGPSLDGGW